MRLGLVSILWCVCGAAQTPILIEGGRLIDGSGRAPIDDSLILIRGERIEQAGPGGAFAVPADAERVLVQGKTVAPGFIDLHFHIEDDPSLVPLFLAAGVTSARDPGAWMELFAPVKQWRRRNGVPGPRLFLCGPHLDGPDPAYPEDAVVILSPEEARRWVRGQIAQGATAIKVYFRLPLESIRAAAEEAHRFGVPVTAHLEIIDPRAAVEAGVDGLEHITSLAIPLVPPREAERYRQEVLADNDARRLGRYRLWASIDPEGPAARELAEFLARRGVFVDPNLAVFERRPDPDDDDSAMKVRAWENMRRYVGVLHRAGVPIVVGSHSQAPFAERGWAYHRELETLVEAGLTPLEALTAATRVGARFLGRDADLGEIAPGRLADLLVFDGDPSRDIREARRVRRVMIGGEWIDPTAIPPLPRP